MPAKRGKKSREKRFEERAEDFGEEVSRMGERFGREAECFGKDAERKWHSAFGFFGPLIASIFGIIVFVICLWLLGFVAVRGEISFLLAIKGFLFANLDLFFILFLFFNYAEYFSKAFRRAYLPFSPIVKAAGLAVAIWVLANIVIISQVSFLAPIKWIAEFALARLFWIFAFFTVLDYLVLLIFKKPEMRKREASFMERTKQSRGNAKIKRLYRSGKDKILGGVCGGIAEYLGVDPVLIRLLWVFGTLVSIGTGIVVYIIAWIIIPRNPAHKWD